MQPLSKASLCLAAVIAGFVVGKAAAQPACSGVWLPPEQVPGLDGEVWALKKWDPDGPGGVSEKLIAGGTFTRAGTQAATGLAIFDPDLNQWSGVEVGDTRRVFPIVTGSSGALFAAFASNSGVRMMRWNGSAWEPLGGVFNEYITCAVEASNGDLIVSGGFSTVGGAPIGRLARWNGTSWSTFSEIDGVVTSLLYRADGALVALGDFVSIGGSPIRRLATWNGQQWSAFDPQSQWRQVDSAVLLPNGDLVVAGLFGQYGGSMFARWNGAWWTLVGPGPGFTISRLGLGADGSIMAAGWQIQAAYRYGHVAKWNGTNWVSIGERFNASASVLETMSNGRTFVGGSFSGNGSKLMGGVSELNEADWSSTTPGVALRLHAAALGTDGLLVAYSHGHTWGLSMTNGVARVDGAGTTMLGGDFAGDYSNAIRCLTEAPNGDIIAGGYFHSLAGLQGIERIARWNGTQWSPLGLGGIGFFNGPVNGVAAAPDGTVYAAGEFTSLGTRAMLRTAKFQGSTWSTMGEGFNGNVSSLVRTPNGNLVAAGDFTMSGANQTAHIARWSGSSWQPMGEGFDAPVQTLLALSDGSILAAGRFTHSGTTEADHVARWNGFAWQPMSLNMGENVLCVYALLELADGRIAATVERDDSAFAAYENLVTLWDGSAWRIVASGLASPIPVLATGPLGEILLGGSFNGFDQLDSAYVARLAIPSADFDHDGDFGTDADVEAFFRCLTGDCCPRCWPLGADLDGDGLAGSDLDVEFFFRTLAGTGC